MRLGPGNLTFFCWMFWLELIPEDIKRSQNTKKIVLQHASHSKASHDFSAEIGTGITWETSKAILLKAENLIAHWLYDWCLSFTTFNMTPKSHDLNWKASCKSACQLRRVDKKHGWLSLHKLSRGATGRETSGGKLPSQSLKSQFCLN